MQELKRKIQEQYNRAMVTGGAGFIGSHICEALLGAGIEVVSVDDYSGGKVENHQHLDGNSNFVALNMDITDRLALEAAFDGVDIVFHNAASKKNICLKDPLRDLAVNAGGAFNLLEFAKKHGVKKFVHASTGSVYGNAVVVPQTEDHPLNPVSYYGVSKLAGERYVNLFHHVDGLNTSIIRYFHVYGPRQESNEFGGVVSIFIRNMIRGEQPVIFGDGTQERTFTYVEDVVKVNLTVATNPKANGGIYNCASAISVTIQELCDAVIENFGMKGKIAPRYEDWLIGDIKVFHVDNQAVTNLGVQFEKDFFKMLEHTIQEMRSYL